MNQLSGIIRNLMYIHSSRILNLKVKYPITEEWIQKLWLIYTMECYSAIKHENMLSFEGKWMELENIILREVTQTQKDMHGISH